MSEDSQLVLRYGCNALLPVTTTISELKSHFKGSDASIRSSVVERTSCVNPVTFRSLQENTDIAQPPENWLKTSNQWEKLIKRFMSPPGASHSTQAPPDDLAESFQLANGAIDILPYLDVVSSSETLKTLLRVPYDNEQILSLAIHRIGKTFLIDNFDVYTYLVDAQRSDWHWIRKWFRNNDEKRMALLLAASSNRCRAKTREKIRERDMLSKFLYYSIGQNEYPISLSPTPQIIPPVDTASSEVVSGNVAPTLLKPSVQKTAMWTLEDMKLLVGSDLPVFSTGNHPCFSLRLCDRARPINVMTGLECWLDNLMCNVPEVLMCFHQEGIVQKYEVYKTEDLPELSDECRFSPVAVKDFATNILSFLRSNATKEGHTYWLLKEPDIDVVKLYDLTSLCEGFMDSVNDNPFALPLAVLLCRLAFTILERSDDDQVESVPHLLDSCLKLVDRDRYPWLYSIVNYLYFTAETKIAISSKSSGENEDSSTGRIDDVANFEVDSIEKRSLLNLQYIANGLAFLISGKEEENALATLTGKSFPVKWTPNQQTAMTAKLLRGGVNCYLHVAAVTFDSLITRDGQHQNQNPTDECLCINIRRYLRIARDCLASHRVVTKSQSNDATLYSSLLQLIGDIHFISEDKHANCEVELHCYKDEISGKMDEINEMVAKACNRILEPCLTAQIDNKTVENFIGSVRDSNLKWPTWSTPIDRIESAIQIYQLAFENSDDQAAVVRRLGNACVEFANAIITRSLEVFSNNELEANQVELDNLWKKAYFAFDKAALLFEAVQPIDVNNLAVVESNRARLMRVCAYCQPKSAFHYLTEAVHRYGIALKHLDNQDNSVSGIVNRIRWDLSSVHLAIADELNNQGTDSEENDRAVLKHLSEAVANISYATYPDGRSRDGEINLREAKVRSKMLLRLLKSSADSKLCSTYLKLIEKSLEKSFSAFSGLSRWEDWACGHVELISLLTNPLLRNFLHRKILLSKISVEIGNIAKPFLNSTSSKNFPENAFLQACTALSKLLQEVSNICPSVNKTVNEVNEMLQVKDLNKLNVQKLKNLIKQVIKHMK